MQKLKIKYYLVDVTNNRSSKQFLNPGKSIYMAPANQTTPDAAKVLAACDAYFQNYISDCSGFVKAVAAALGIILTGLADDIVAYITSGNGWTQLADGDGPSAKAYADSGWFVVGGLQSTELANQPQSHGHVIVVVTGPLDGTHDKYPTAWWGKLGGVGSKNSTVNWAFNTQDRDRVHYAAIQLAD